MGLTQDEDMRRIYEQEYPCKLIFPTALTRNKEQVVIVHLGTAVVCSDKQGHPRQNVRVEVDVERLDTEQGIVEGGKYVMIFPRISFYLMMCKVRIPLNQNERSYRITFKKKNEKCYEITKSTVIPIDSKGVGMVNG